MAQSREGVDPYVFIVGNRPVLAKPGMVFLSHDESFSIIRGGHIDITVMGGMQVDSEGSLANAHAPGKPAPNFGGAQDLATCAKRTIIMMYHTASDRSEEHTSELQSLMRISSAVFCLKKKTTNHKTLTQSTLHI